ncbi:MAG: sel1 repeat family protein [Bacteroidales bacterium]|nr:sel1 repeat family protein [Bacteroidales bacterium]
MSNRLQSGDESFNRGDYKSAFGNYKKAANDGDGEAAYKIGQMYEKGLGVSIDRNEAMKWYVIAAGKGYDKAQSIFNKQKPQVETPEQTSITEEKTLVVERPKGNKTTLIIAIAAAALICGIIAAVVMQGSDEKSDYATEKIPEYRKLVEECSSLTNSAVKDGDMEKLLNAKSKLSQIKLLDSKYGKVMPLEYNKSNNFAKLDKALKQKCAEYCEKALANISDISRVKSYLMMAKKFCGSEQIDKVLKLAETKPTEKTKIEQTLKQIITDLK